MSITKSKTSEWPPISRHLYKSTLSLQILAGIILAASPVQAERVFDTEEHYIMDSAPKSIAVDDFNEDGKEDLAVAVWHSQDRSEPLSTSGTVSILLNQGDGKFGDKTDYIVGPSPTTLVSADINGDGKADLAVGGDTGILSFLPGKGDGTFGEKREVPLGESGISSLVAGDFTGDGRTDLAASLRGEYRGEISGNSLILLQADDGGSIRQVKTYPLGIDLEEGPLPQSMIKADVNRDGQPDLVIANGVGIQERPEFTYGSLTLFINRGGGDFTKQTLTRGTESFTAVAAGDFNEDGRTDLAGISVSARENKYPLWQLKVWLQGIDGSFTLKTTLPRYGSRILRSGDVDGDGSVDLLLSGGSALFQLPGKGDGTFGESFAYPVSSDITDFEIEDLNQDSRLDFAVSIQGYADYPRSNRVEVLLGKDQPSGLFGPSISNNFVEEGTLFHPVVEDFNHDGIDDIAAIEFYFAPDPVLHHTTVRVLLGGEDGRTRIGFSYGPLRQSRNAPSIAEGLFGVDFNGDGRKDLLVIKGQLQELNKAATVLLGRGDGTFTPAHTIPLNFGIREPLSWDVGDFNGDGRTDLFVRYDRHTWPFTWELRVFLGTADGMLQPGDPHQVYRFRDTAVVLGEWSGPAGESCR